MPPRMLASNDASVAVVSGSGLVLSDVRFAFRRGAPMVLRQVSLRVPPGAVSVVRGPNGSGKTTLLRLAAGILRPVSGSVERPDVVGYQPQALGDPPPRMTAGAWLATLGQIRGRSSAALAVDLLERLGGRPDLPLSACSRGTLAKVLVAAALAGPPDLAVLDEPFAAMDEDSSRAAGELIRRAADDGAAVLIADHSPHLPVPGARTVSVRDGRLVEPSTSQDAPLWRVETLGPDGVRLVQELSAAERDRVLLMVLRQGGQVIQVQALP